MCSWTWDAQTWSTITVSDSTTNGMACQCKAGTTGSGVGVSQDTEPNRPTYNPSAGRLVQGGLDFHRAASQYLHSAPKTWMIKANGGLTIVAEIKFSGTVGRNEIGRAHV